MQCFICMFHNKEKYLKLLYSELRDIYSFGEI